MPGFPDGLRRVLTATSSRPGIPLSSASTAAVRIFDMCASCNPSELRQRGRPIPRTSDNTPDAWMKRLPLGLLRISVKYLTVPVRVSQNRAVQQEQCCMPCCVMMQTGGAPRDAILRGLTIADTEAVQVLGICQIVDRCSPVPGAGYANSAQVSALTHAHVVVMTVGRPEWRVPGESRHGRIPSRSGNTSVPVVR